MQLHLTRALVAIGVLAMMQTAIVAGQTSQGPIATTRHFAFYSDFDTNLNDALIVAGMARKDDKPELFHSGTEEACFAALAPSARSGWNGTVDFYAEIISPTRWSDRPQTLLRSELAGLEHPDEAAGRQFLEIARGFLMAATPAYETCRWKSQQAENLSWLSELTPRLKAHEVAIGDKVEKLYQTSWHGLPLRVDLVETAPPVGANSRILNPGGHILVSSETAESDSLEIMFHEASHTLAAPWRPDPIPKALADAAKKLEVPLPRDLWHPVLFYTTGQAVRSALAEAGEPDYTPYVDAHNLWSGPWGRYRSAIEATWPAYLSGERSLSEAADALMRALSDAEKER